MAPHLRGLSSKLYGPGFHTKPGALLVCHTAGQAVCEKLAMIRGIDHLEAWYSPLD